MLPLPFMPIFRTHSKLKDLRILKNLKVLFFRIKLCISQNVHYFPLSFSNWLITAVTTEICSVDKWETSTVLFLLMPRRNSIETLKIDESFANEFKLGSRFLQQL